MDYTVKAKRADGTYVIEFADGMPYHVERSDPLFNEVERIGAGAPLDPMKPVAPPIAPSNDMESVPSITFVQAISGMVMKGWLTQEEGLAWSKDGTLPSEVEAMISDLPPAEQVFAKISATRSQSMARNEPLMLKMAETRGVTADEMDEFFTTFSKLGTTQAGGGSDRPKTSPVVLSRLAGFGIDTSALPHYVNRDSPHIKALGLSEAKLNYIFGGA